MMAAAVVGGICVLTLRRHAPELSFVLTLLLSAGAALFGLRLMAPVTAFISKAAELAGLPMEWLNPLYKTTGLAILTRLAADLMRDTGQLGLASAVEMAGGFAAIAAALPLLEALLGLLSGLAG